MKKNGLIIKIYTYNTIREYRHISLIPVISKKNEIVMSWKTFLNQLKNNQIFLGKADEITNNITELII